MAIKKDLPLIQAFEEEIKRQKKDRQVITGADYLNAANAAPHTVADTQEASAATEAVIKTDPQHKQDIWNILQSPNAPVGFKVTNYLDALSAAGQMSADTKAYYDAIREEQEQEEQEREENKGTPKRTWFQTPAQYLDGKADILDNAAAILGTATDLAQEVGEGAMEMGEKIVDAGAYAIGATPGLQHLIFGDNVRGKMENFIKKDLYDSEKIIKSGANQGVAPLLLETMGTDEEEASALGERSEALANSAGQLAVQVGLSATPAGWLAPVVTGTTSFGGEVESALNQGASYGEAGVSALIAAGAEVLTEQLGGIKFGGKAIMDRAIDKAVDKVSSKVAKYAAKYAINAGSEGAEEFVSQVFSNLGSAIYKSNPNSKGYTGENVWEVLTNDEALDGYLESVLGGIILGSAFEGGEVVKSAATGVNYVTGLTQDQQIVVDKIVENKVAQMEASGKKLTKKERADIYNDTVQQVKKGTVSKEVIDAILDDLFRGANDAPVSGETATAPQQGASDGKLTAEDLTDIVDEAVAKQNGAPADPIAAALESIANGGAVTNKQAQDIMNNTRAVQRLVQEAGLTELKGTASQNRAAVKAAVLRLSQQQTTVDTAANTDYDNINNTQGGNDYVAGQQQVDYSGVRRSPQIDSQGEITGSTGNGSAYAGSSTQSGNPGGGNRGILYSADSEGRALTSNQSARLQETAVIDKNGAPIAVYHATDNMDFDTFAKGDTGFHFGTQKQAQKRSSDKGIAQGRIFRAYLNIKNPIRVRNDIMGWTPRGTALALWSDGVLSDAEYNEVISLWQKGDGYDSASATRLREILENKGYDGIVYPNGFEGDGDSYIAFRDDQIIRSEITEFANDETGKSAPATPAFSDESVGVETAADDLNAELQQKYGTIPSGENPVRPDDLPKRDIHGDKVSKTAVTVKGAEVTSDEFADLLNKDVAQGGMSYIPITNSETIQKAYEHIKSKGWDIARGEWSTNVRAGKAGADLVAQGALLLNNAAKAGDKATWLDILHDYQLLGTNTAQGLQALRILKTLTPDDKLYMARRSVKQMIQDMHLDTKITIDEDLQAKFLAAETDEMRNAVLKEIQKNVASQLPSTFMEKFTALRYVNMLGNLRTQGRNVIGNLGMKAVRSVQNSIAASMEALASKISGGKLKRTRSAFVSKAQKVAAAKDFDHMQSAILDGGKYSDSSSFDSTEFAKGVQKERRIFGVQDGKKYSKAANVALAPLEGYRKVTNWAMEQGDIIFARSAYARALAGYLKANGITETDYSKVDTEVMDDARLFAAKEAQEATFRDTNRLSGWISKLGRRKDTPAAVKFISEGIMPFRKTPANVLVRAEEYSPLGVINSLATSIRAMQKNSDVTGAQVINSWAKTLTGTGLFFTGMLLSNLGILSAGADEDKDKDAFESMNGQQNYAFTIPGTDINFTIDFLSPSAMPVLMGAQLMETMNDGGLSLKDVESALTSLVDPMIEMSMLQGINDTLENIQYADNNLMQLTINAALNYLTQGLTNTFLGQVERTFEDSREQTYVDKDSALPDWLQRVIGKASAKIPGWDYQQIPYVNAWGEEEENPEWYINGAYNTLSPAYIEKGVSNELTEELNRLNDAQGDVNVYPSAPDKTVTYNRTTHNLSAEEYVALAKKQGQMRKNLVERIIASKDYAALSDTGKAKAIEFAYDYARDYARGEVLEGHPGVTTKWMKEWSGDIADGILRYVSAGTTSKYADIPIDAAAYIADILDNIQPEGNSKKPRDIQRMEATVNANRLTEDQQELVLRDIMGDSLEAKFDAALDMGITAEDFVEAYRQYLDASGSGKKNRTVAYFVKEMGLTRSEAEALYDLYSGNK